MRRRIAMDTISKEDIEDLWEELESYTWSDFYDLLYYYRNDTRYNFYTMEGMLEAAEKFKKNNEPFPQTAERLYDLLNQYLTENGYLYH